MIREASDTEEINKAEFVYRFTGPIAEHNYLCAVCREKSAILECHTGTLHPCWECQKLGYKLIKEKRKGWLRRFLTGSEL